MAELKIRYMRRRKGAFYYIPNAAMTVAGFRCEPLGRDMARAIERAEALNSQWDRIKAGLEAQPDPAPRGSLAWLIERYRGSTWFRDLAETTTQEAERQIAYLESSPLVRFNVREIDRQAVRTIYEKCAARHGVWKARDVHKRLARILSYGVETGVITANPAHKMQLSAPRPRRTIWRREQVQAAIDKALELGERGVALAIALGYDSGQDLMVILRQTWAHFDGEGMAFRRTKTGIASWSPLSAQTLRLLHEVERTSTHIVTTPAGLPIGGRSQFGKRFRKVRAAAGLPDELRFRDLRRTVGTEIDAGGGNIEPILGLEPGSPVKKHYIVPSKSASREAQSRRNRDQVRPES